MGSSLLLHCLILVTINSLIITTVALKEEDPDVHKKTPEFITSYGYPLENHTIITKDGYILTYFRIPYGKKSPLSPGEKKPTVLLQHGLLSSSAEWFVQPPETMLPFLLADAGYDVWLGNNRGTQYSTGHTNPLYKSSIPVNIYWGFSWEEMGRYDLPAAIDHILQCTCHKSIFYIGHSQGTTQFFVLLSLLPEYNAKIKLGALYSPVAFFAHVQGPIGVLGPIAKTASIASVSGLITSDLGVGKFLPKILIEILYKLLPTVCDVSLIEYGVCANVIFLLVGFDYEQTNFDRLPVALSQFPDTTSVMCILHYGQLMDPLLHTFKFTRFDYGLLVNTKVYGSLLPPAFNLTKITAPVALYHGANDFLAEPKDVQHLKELLPNVVEYYQVPWAKWNHLDYVTAKNASQWLYQPTLELMKTYL